MGPRSRHTAQEGDAFCLLEINVHWCEKCKSISEQQQMTLWRCWRKQVQKYLYQQQNESYIDVTWKAAQQGRSHHSKTTIKKSQNKVCNWTWGQRSYFLEKCPLVWWNKNITFWPQWPSLCLEGKGGGLQAEEHHPNREARGWQHHVVGVLCCRRVWCISQNRWHHEEG